MPARLCILGQGEFEGTLRQLIAARGLGDAVSLAGFQANPWKFIARADVFLLTSRYEGFGNVLIEAMACGVPVVATASAGTRDIVQHGIDGLLVDVHSLQRRCHQRAEHPRIAFAPSGDVAAATESAERFAVPQVVARYDAVLEQLAS